MVDNNELFEIIKKFLIDEEIDLLEISEEEIDFTNNCSLDKKEEKDEEDVDIITKALIFQEDTIKELSSDLEDSLNCINELRCDIITKSFECEKKDKEIKELKNKLNLLNKNNHNLINEVILLKSENECLKSKISEVKKYINNL